MSPTLVDLRPNRHLLDHNFEGYKLNLQALPHYSCDLECRVDRLYPDEAQYSFVHAKLFALHNHLVLDHWDYSFNYYYIDNNRQVRHITFENTTHTFHNKVVYDVPVNVERKSGHFNLCLSFPSSELALISDGTGYLHILKTGPRNRPGINYTWDTTNTFLVLGEGKYFGIVDSRIQEKDNTILLHCLLQSVEHNYIHFKSVLSWVTYTFNGKIWKQTSFKRIEGKGIIHYAAIESKGGALYIASDNGFEFTADSAKDKESEDPLTRVMERKLLYTWHQSPEDLCITLKLEPNFNRNYFQCEVDLHSVKVTYAGKDIIDGKLMARVDAELTTWNIQDNGQVDILITKYKSDMWDDLLEFMDESGEQIMDPVMLEETHQRLAHLCSEVDVTADQPLPGLDCTQQLEECDAPSDEDTVLVRIDASSHQITHRVPLSVHQYLFSIRIEPNEAPGLVLRHDVDACIWQPYAQVINSKMWPVKHQGTLMAFGYVQSSKQSKKFITCPPNFSYSVVCEASRHIFIYQSPNNSESQLKKRSGGVMKPVNVGNQHVFNIDKYGEVVGINATNEFLLILTETKFVAIQVQ